MTFFLFILGGLFNPAALSYPEALYLDPRLQSMLRSNPHAALYSQLASPYASHLYGLMPGGPPNLSGLHERMKLEEEHRARIAREEEKARIAREEEKARERERELREKEMREREQREKEHRDREMREKEMRERELRDREMREKEMRDRELREKEHREREMRDKEMREREKLLQQHHFMQSQRNNPYNILGLFPQMVGLRPPSGMHPGYPMHHSLLGLPLPSQIPTSLSSSMSLSHHSQSPGTGSSSVPITSSSGMSLMSPMGAMGFNSSGHGLPHGMSLYPGNHPPPAHLYSPLAPPSASPSSLGNSSYNHPMMNPATSPQPISRSPSSNHQSLNLSKNQISSSSQYSSKGHESRHSSDKMSSSNVLAPSIATVSVPSLMNDKNFKIELPNISNGNNLKSSKDGLMMKTEARDLSAVKSEKPKEEKLSPVDELKPIVLEKPPQETVKISDNEMTKPEDKIERMKEEDNKIKADNSPQDFSSPKDFDQQKEIKAEAEDKPPSSNDNKISESESLTDTSGANETAADVKEEEMKIDETPSINDESADDIGSTKNNETLKTSNKK